MPSTAASAKSCTVPRTKLVTFIVISCNTNEPPPAFGRMLPIRSAMTRPRLLPEAARPRSRPRRVPGSAARTARRPPWRRPRSRRSRRRSLPGSGPRCSLRAVASRWLSPAGHRRAARARTGRTPPRRHRKRRRYRRARPPSAVSQAALVSFAAPLGRHETRLGGGASPAASSPPPRCRKGG